MSLFTLALVFGIAVYLRTRNVKWHRGIPTSAAVTPLAVAFESFVYPADPEWKMWAAVAIPVSFVYALVAAGLGYGVGALVNKHREG